MSSFSSADRYDVRDVVMGNLSRWAEDFKYALREYVKPTYDVKIKIGNWTFQQQSCYNCFFFLRQVEETLKEGPEACNLSEQDFNQVKLWKAQMTDELKIVTGDSFKEWRAMARHGAQGIIRYD